MPVTLVSSEPLAINLIDHAFFLITLRYLSEKFIPRLCAFLCFSHFFFSLSEKEFIYRGSVLEPVMDFTNRIKGRNARFYYPQILSFIRVSRVIRVIRINRIS